MRFEYVPAFNKVFDLDDFFSLTAGGSIGIDPGFNLASQFSVQGLPGGNSIVLTDGQRTGLCATTSVAELVLIAILLRHAAAPEARA